ncbi:hypothetical protein ACIPLC_18560 [Kitasatospora sp. NPDC086801]
MLGILAVLLVAGLGFQSSAEPHSPLASATAVSAPNADSGWGP